MEQQGEYVIPAAQQRVWEALNDEDVLARCIPGCQSMVREDPQHFSARVKAKVGPVSAVFEVGLELVDVQAPHGYRINGSVKGGPAGFGKGGATVRLEPVDLQQTRLTYAVDASIGGKLAQVGSRLIDAATRKMADEFFAAFSAQVGLETAETETMDGMESAADPHSVASPTVADPSVVTPWTIVPADPEPAGQSGAVLDRDSADATAANRYESSGQWPIWVIVVVVFVLAMVLAF